MANALRDAAMKALSKMPYSIASKELPVRVAAGRPLTHGYDTGRPAIASTDAEDPNAPITVENQDLWKNPDYTPQLLRHEMTHQVQKNWAPKILQSLPPVNPQDPYNYGGVEGLRKIGGDPTKLSVEQQAAVQQEMQAMQQNGQRIDPIYKTFDQKFGEVPLSVMEPTDPEQKGINTTPRPPGLPADPVAGMGRLYTDHVVRVRAGSGRDKPQMPPGARLRLLKASGGMPARAVIRRIAAEKPDAIGTVEGKTDRVVLQQPKSAEKIQELATDEHGQVKSALKTALEGISGAKLYADREEKDPERVAEKTEEGQSPRTVRDYSGFRVSVDSPEAWKRTAAALRAHFEVPDEQDEFEKGSDLHFHGHNAQVRLPGSKVTHEVQILPREVAENADKDHPLYEKQRDGDKEAERKLIGRNEEHWNAFRKRNGLAVGAGEGGSGKPEPAAGAARDAASAAVPNTLMAEKLRAALEKKRGTAATPVPVASTAAKAGTAKPPGAMRVKVSAAMLQPVTGTPEEAEQLDLIRPDLGRWVADYLARNTKDGVTTVATDAAKAMLPAFAADPLKNDGNVGAAAAAIRDGALNTILQSPPDAAKPYALLAVGSPGSGKTTSLALGGERAKVGLKIEAIPDDVSKFVLLLRKILASGRKPIVEWVWAGTPKATAARMMLRAVGDGPRPGIGRVVHTAYMAKAWAGLPKVLEQARKELGPQVIWLLADNSGPPGTAKVTQDLGAWLRRGEAIKEPNAHAQMEAELEAMERRGKLKGERGKASLAAARLNQPGMPRTEILDVPEGPKDGRADLQHRMRSLAAAKDAGKALADTRGAEESAWKRAGDTLREDPKAQVPF